jgi:hypothetical protein
LVANKAIKDGLLTYKEATIICHLGTRKQNYWARHVRDLCAVILDRNPSNDLIKMMQKIRRGDDNQSNI